MYRVTAKDPELVCQGEAEEIGRPNSSFWFKHGGVKDQQQAAYADHGEALTQALKPSVIRIRMEGLRAEEFSRLVQTVLRQCEAELQAGAMISVNGFQIRIRRLPVP